MLASAGGIQLFQAEFGFQQQLSTKIG